MHISLPLVPLSQDCALFLDIDGTLLDLAATPDEVAVPWELPLLLRKLGQRLCGALALVSGRRLADIEALFGDGIAMAAEHGAVLRHANGQLIAEACADPVLAMLAHVLSDAIAARPGTLLEQKNFGLVVHWRGAPGMAEELAAYVAALAAPYPQLTLLPAHAALEIRLRGADKAWAMEMFMRLPPFVGRWPLFIGDDITDEPAIARAQALGGVGLHVRRDFGGCPAAVRNWLAAGLKGDKSHAART